MGLRLIRHIQAIGFLQWTLFVWINVDVALDALLAVVGPRVTGHPHSIALWALVLPEAALLTLVRGFSFRFWSSLRAVSDVMAFLEAQVTQIVGGWDFAVF